MYKVYGFLLTNAELMRLVASIHKEEPIAPFDSARKLGAFFTANKLVYSSGLALVYMNRADKIRTYNTKLAGRDMEQTNFIVMVRALEARNNESEENYVEEPYPVVNTRCANATLNWLVGHGLDRAAVKARWTTIPLTFLRCID
jgi:hypothetical protein